MSGNDAASGPAPAPAPATDATATATGADPAGALDEAQVLVWLKANPLFLGRHPALLEDLDLAHVAGSAVSLIERQVELLRGKNQRLEARLDKLTGHARANEGRTDRLMKLALALIRAPSLGAIAAAFREAMQADFGLDAAGIGLQAPLYRRHDIDGIVPIEPQGPLARALDNFLRTRLIECGPIEPARAALLFPGAAAPIASAAIVPLERDKQLGYIALGSSDAERFQPRQGQVFLEMTAELISAAVRSRLS